eukprot:251581-Amphidinium_carterae.1
MVKQDAAVRGRKQWQRSALAQAILYALFMSQPQSLHDTLSPENRSESLNKNYTVGTETTKYYMCENTSWRKF